MRSPALAASLVLAGLLACRPPGAPGDETGSEESTGASTGAVEIPEPAFLNPAIGEFKIDTTQTTPEVFILDRVLPGITQVLLDGFSLGTLAPGDPLGTLTAEQMDLTLHGAMTAGKHSLQLVTASPDGLRGSTTLTMAISPPGTSTRPTFTVELAPTAITGGLALLASGAGPARLLGVVTPGDPDPELQLLRPADGGWSDKPIRVPLDGHVPEVLSSAPAVAAVAFPEPDGAPAKRLRVAFSVGLPAHTIAARDIAANPDPIVLNTFPAFDLDAALADEPVEWAAFGRPFLLGHTLLAELVAAADTEAPHPGDLRVVTSFWQGDDLQWTPPQLVGMPSPTDLDALAAAPVVPDIPIGRSTALAVRLGGAFPGLLEARDDGTVSITTTALTAPLGVDGDLVLSTLVGSFGGRTIAAVDRHGAAVITLLNTGSSVAARSLSLPGADLPDAAPTGELAPGVGRGFALFLVPYGDAAPVHLLLSDGYEAAVYPLDLPAPVHCDSVALAATLDGNDPDGAALPLACLSHGELSVGRLIVVAPG